MFVFVIFSHNKVQDGKKERIMSGDDIEYSDANHPKKLSNKKVNLTVGAIVGIAVGAVVLCFIIFCCIGYCCCVCVRELVCGVWKCLCCCCHHDDDD